MKPQQFEGTMTAPTTEASGDFRLVSANATADELVYIRNAVRCWLDDPSVESADPEGVVLALHEAMANVVEHAYPAVHGTFDVHAASSAYDRTLTVTVTDRGHWLDTPPGKYRGRGLPLMSALADHVDVERRPDGTTVTLRWRGVLT